MKSVIFGLLFSQLTLLPLSHRYELDLGKVIPCGLAVGLVAGSLVAVIGSLIPVSVYLQILLTVLLVVAGCVAGFALLFFRNNERTVQGRRDVIVSPVDGTIRYIRRIEKDCIPLSVKGKERVCLPETLLRTLPDVRGYLVGVGMTLLNGHVTRSPMEGELVLSEYAGRFLPSGGRRISRGDERMIQIVGNGDSRVGLIHIASFPGMRIESCVKVGDRVSLGQKIGTIRFDSQVDLVVPDRGDLEINVNVGDRVFAGVTIIARSRAAEPGQ